MLTSSARAPGLAVPLYLKRAVDALSGTVTDVSIRACAIALLASGGCRVANSITKEMQGPVFTPVSQARSHRSSAGWQLWNMDAHPLQLLPWQRGNAFACSSASVWRWRAWRTACLRGLSM